MAGSLAARYLVAAFAFMAAATWVGVSLTGGFTCLFVFVLALQAVRLYQRHTARSHRSSSKRERPSGQEPDWAEEMSASSAPPARRDRSRLAGRVYDGDREELGWPMSSEATW